MKSSFKQGLLLLVLLMAGIVIGGLLGNLIASIEILDWLNFGYTFGMKSPLILDFEILYFSFAFNIKVTISSIIGILIALLVYKNIRI